MSFVVAIDGPAGTGKGTVTKILAKELNLVNIDTGATYRCVALYTIKKIIENLKNIHIDMKNENGEQTIFLNNEDVTEQIRTNEVNKIVSQISSIKEVRYAMVDVQRKLAEGKDVIMEGRDITTYVFPNADVKIYLDGDEKERVLRRYKQMIEKGMKTTYEEVLQNVRLRDKNDKEKEIGALKIAKDAVYIDTTNMSVTEEVEKIKNIIDQKRLKNN